MRTPLVFLIFLSISACKREPTAAEPPKQAAPAAAEPKAEAKAEPKSADGRVIPMQVTTDGFVPENVALKANEPVKFVVTRTTDETCAKDLLIEGTDIKVSLPLNKAVEVAWTPAKAGKVKFGCAMDMMVGGVLVVE